MKEAIKNLIFNFEEERRKIAANLIKEIDRIQIEKADKQEMALTPQASRLKSGVTHLVGGQTEDDVKANRVTIAKRNVDDKHSKALLKSKELKEVEDKKAQLLKEQCKLYAKNLEDRAKKREQTLKAIAETAKQIRYKLEDNIQSESLFCLHYALTAIHSLQDIMQVAATLWRDTRSFFNEFSEAKILRQVSHLRVMPEETRHRLWNTKTIKIEAIKYYSKWVAIRKAYTDSRVSITSAQCQMHLIIQENPTKKEAINILQILADEFGLQVGQIPVAECFDQ